jgi:hypothetical protein
MSEHPTLRRPRNRAPDRLPSPSPDTPATAGSPGRRPGEWLVFTAATLVGLVHGLDDAWVNRQPGVGDDHALAAALAIALAVAGIAAFPRLRPGLRAGIALIFGALAVINGALHVIHIAVDGPARSDLTGVLAVAAGVVLVGLGAAIPFRHRGERARTWRRRWANRLVAVVSGIVVGYVVLYGVGVAITLTHKYREPIGSPPSPAYQPVTFTSSDGLRLSGWYVPSRNRAVVVVVHGGGGDRMGARSHAQLLARHGYGVLLYDSRGRGESEGSPNALGWGWEKDVAGALDFLRERPDVDRDRIGGLGLSTGADVLMEVAPERRDLRAVVADGATGRSYEDLPPSAGPDLKAPFRAMYTAAEVISGSSPGPPLRELVPRISPTPLLLISAGRGRLGATEREFNQIYAGAAREPVELWDLRDVRHTAAIRERAEEYERRVVGLFDRALLEGR